MTVQKNAYGTYFSYRDDGALECWGIVDITPGEAKHIRQGNIFLEKYKEPPSLTTNFVGTLRPTTHILGYDGANPGKTAVAFDYSFDESNPNLTLCKVTATNTESGAHLTDFLDGEERDIPFSCHFHAIGLPAKSG